MCLERWTDENLIDRLEVERPMARLKCGKVVGMDGITAEMLKYGGECCGGVDAVSM